MQSLFKHANSDIYPEKSLNYHTSYYSKKYDNKGQYEVFMMCVSSLS